MNENTATAMIGISSIIAMVIMVVASLYFDSKKKN